jgi:hypothetical protein
MKVPSDRLVGVVYDLCSACWLLIPLREWMDGGTSAGRDTRSHDSGTVLRDGSFLGDMTAEPVCDGVSVTREPSTSGFGVFFLTA